MNDCGDNSDENPNCNVDECQTGENNCTHVCIDELIGFTCDCPDGFVLNKITNQCEDKNECVTLENACPNMPCINLNGSYECDCRMFQYVTPIYPCKRDQKDKPLLLYITHDDIRLTNISIYASESKSSSILYSNLTSGGVIDYNMKNNYIVWSDTKQKTINVAVMDKEKSITSAE
ncbi:low-density lipoprotein receptor-related protein 1-like protein [Leptotrombidium deliense]|uniref:Low-density lipoprotein receptor-related protein 1-like protein n=1 Tax=Leptotrombidium deliense TaxID=299467 RepID=A0A443R7T5_9ACAR|nr:low-density lipoprotein receptor-related protein 1-like protein [Leptotrombidium deliense]